MEETPAQQRKHANMQCVFLWVGYTNTTQLCDPQTIIVSVTFVSALVRHDSAPAMQHTRLNTEISYL